MNVHPTHPIEISRLVTVDGLSLPLQSAHLRARAGAGYAEVTLVQTFLNPTALPVEVLCQVPLPADAAVGGFEFLIGDERVVGRVEPKARAQAVYAEALRQGRTAALLDQERDSLFSQRVGNVPPGAVVQVTIRLDQPLAWRDGAWEWRFPTVVAPKFVDDAVTDAAALAVDVSAAPLPARLSLHLEVTDAVIGRLSSPSHDLQPDGATVRLAGGRARLDRDVVVRWSVAEAAPGVHVQVGAHGGERFALITVVPPMAPRRAVPRDLILLLDVSGSMGGEPMAQLQRVCHELVGGLTAEDTLEAVAFGGDVRRWRPSPEPMHEVGRAAAQRWVAGLRASGGTPMDDGIREALAGRRADAQRQVLLVTDGHIGFEARIVGMIRDQLGASSRLHVLGIGHGVNRALTTPAARAGAGVEEILAPGEPVGPALARLAARLERPALVDLDVRGDLIDLAPARRPDVFAGAPVRLLARLPATGDGHLQLRARGPEGAWSFNVDLPAGGVRDDLARLYAREAVADHEVARAAGDTSRDAAIEALGVRFQISTRLTSFVAVAERSTAVPLDGALPTLRVPHELPAGMSLAGLGLIPAPAMAGGGGPQPKLAAPAPTGSLMARSRRSEAVAAPPPMPPSMHAPEPIFAELEESASASAPADAGRAPGYAPPAPAPTPAREQTRRAKRAEPGLIGALRRALRRLIGGAEVEVIDGVTHLWLTAADPLDALILHLVLADGSTRAPSDLAVERLPDGRWWIRFVHDADAVALRTATTELARWG